MSPPSRQRRPLPQVVHRSVGRRWLVDLVSLRPSVAGANRRRNVVSPPRVIPVPSPEQHLIEVPSEQSHSTETWVPSISRQDPGGRKVMECMIDVEQTRNTTAVLTETLVEPPGLLIDAAHAIQAALSTAAIKISRQGEGGEYRRDLRALLRDVVEQISWSYLPGQLQNLFGVVSASHFLAEDEGFISVSALLNFRCGINSLPSPLYKLPQEPKSKKIEDALVYTGPLYRLPPTAKDCRALFLSLTADNWVYCQDKMNGQVHQEIYLGSPNRYKFKHIDWETHGETIILQSLHHHPHRNIAVMSTSQNSRSKPRVLITIAVFSMFPVQFKGMLEIDRAIKSVESDELAENGFLDFPNLSTEPDSIAFHPDDSGRIVYNSSHFIKVFRLVTNMKNKPSLKECFEITFRESLAKVHQEASVDKPLPRKCKSIFDIYSTQCVEKSLLSDDYENELELYSVLGFNPVDESCTGKVGIYDNDTGEQIKCFELGMSLDELCDYTLTLDLDTLVVLAKDERRNFSCFLYRLHFPGHMDDPHSKRQPRVNLGLRRSLRNQNCDASSSGSGSGRRRNENSNHHGFAMPPPPCDRVLRTKR
ncbi:hypothetical protein HPB47_000666 [Ixodes persulcatus]|uniref:Uncharacterized protein n=1 Tax=Ixodes persulcatus TaxID=34615 RepID=A0AC60PSR9_IXOPE|nr:hypothetical protein HPB47_000666 [Ixodes persulcatus]